MNESAPPSRARQHRARATDAVILDTAVRLASEEGWVGLTPGHLAEVTGLSRPTVLQRHPDRAAVGAATWRRLAPEFMARLQAVVEAAASTKVAASALATSLAPFTQPDDSMAAAVELLVVSSFVPDVAIAVAETLGAQLTGWFHTSRSPAARRDAARRAFATALAIGYVMESRRLAGFTVDLDEEIAKLADALTAPSTPLRLPTAQARHFDAPIAFDTGDPTWDAVLRAALESIGEFGYEAATIEVMAARSGFTRTAIFSRYDTKQELFMDASDRMLGATTRLNIEYQERLQQGQPEGVPDTCFLREIARPTRRRLRTITLEQVRLAAHSEPLRTSIHQAVTQFEEIMRQADPTLSPEHVRAKLMTEMAISTGMLLLAQLTDLAWNLPFDVVLVPWRNAAS